jgi:hypothetical protein
MMSLYTMVFAGVVPLGSLLVGSIAELLGASAAFITGGALSLAAVLSLTFWWRHARGRARGRGPA